MKEGVLFRGRGQGCLTGKAEQAEEIEQPIKKVKMAITTHSA